MTRAWLAFPENERDDFNRAINEAAAFWRRPIAEVARDEAERFQRFMRAAGLR